MKFEKQKQKLNINNLDELFIKKVNNNKHGSLLPNNIRGIICGPSNCGKTNLLINMITDPYGLKFENVYIYSKSLFQPKYVYLKNILSRVKNLGYYEFNDNAKIIEPCDAKKNSLFLFDDISCDSHKCILKYYSTGRHQGIDPIYLAQTYSRTPKQLFRDNLNLLILFRQDQTNLKHIYQDHVNTDMSFDKFKELCRICWNNKYGFVVINKDCELNNGRYRKGFDIFLKE